MNHSCYNNNYAYLSYDELLVGAPLFRTSSIEPEIGRVFLYRNNRVSFMYVAFSLSLSLSLSPSLLPSLSLSEIILILGQFWVYENYNWGTNSLLSFWLCHGQPWRHQWRWMGWYDFELCLTMYWHVLCHRCCHKCTIHWNQQQWARNCVHLSQHS